MIKHIKFVELPVSDQDRALKFYTEILGFTVRKDSPYKDKWRWIELQIPGADTAALLTEKSSDKEPDKPSLVLVVDDVIDVHKALAAKNVRFTQEPTPAPWNKNQLFALLQDSEGNIVMIGSE
jgi:lactoylglutathione lyase